MMDHRIANFVQIGQEIICLAPVSLKICNLSLECILLLALKQSSSAAITFMIQNRSPDVPNAHLVLDLQLNKRMRLVFIYVNEFADL